MKVYLLGALAMSFAIAPHSASAPPASLVPGVARVASLVAVAAQGNQNAVRASSDPADSLYRAAREALANGDYDRAARMFHDIGTRFPKSTLLPDAMYYEAFAQYRSGGTAAMRSARDLLASLQQRYPDFGQRSDAATLSTRICGELARRGDASCAASIAAQASSTAVIRSDESRSTSSTCPTDDNDERIAALNALLQMDADRAEPILEKVLARRDACSASLRRKAVFLVAQKQSPQAIDVLLRAAQTDPDPEVRSQAVFWMSQVHSDRAMSVLSDILHNSSDQALRGKALFALGQSGAPQGTQLLRAYAADAAAPVKLRDQAIFWLGQQKGGAENAQFLRGLYGKLTDDDLKEKVMFSLAQGDTPDRAAWLLDIAQRSSESLAARKQALFLAGQAGASMAQLTRLYDSLPPGALREQMIFVFSQSSDPAALDKLIAIARADKDPESRKKALFWVGQSHDPRALKLLTEMIDK